MEHSGLTASDVLALTRDNNNSDIMGGGYFWWVIIFLIIAAMFSGGGLFGNNAAGANLLDDEFIKRDIFNTNQNVSNTASTTQRDVLESSCQTQRDVLESRYTNQLGVQSIISSQKDCCCETNQNIIQSRYDNALGQANLQKDILLNGRDLQAQIAECCCNIRAEGLANTQKILDKLCESEINTLRDKLNERDRELQSAQFQISQVAQTNNITNTLRPFPQPAYITCSPYQSYSYGYGCGCN